MRAMSASVAASLTSMRPHKAFERRGVQHPFRNREPVFAENRMVRDDLVEAFVVEASRDLVEMDMLVAEYRLCVDAIDLPPFEEVVLGLRDEAGAVGAFCEAPRGFQPLAAIIVCVPVLGRREKALLEIADDDAAGALAVVVPLLDERDGELAHFGALKSSLTMPLALAKSICPAKRSFIAAMTRPISFIWAAPSSAMVASAASLVSSSLICLGMKERMTAISSRSPAASSGRLPAS